ncbi:MAG: hypothetical protein IJY70_02515 [Clostridia bacterium]|nr:hypothetical protein [Clostridia bacterium]
MFYAPNGEILGLTPDPHYERQTSWRIRNTALSLRGVRALTVARLTAGRK